MATEIASPHDIFPHIRIVMGMVIGLGVTRLLSGTARIVQHPGQYRLYAVHLAWVGSVLLMLVHFWWWEFGLYAIESSPEAFALNPSGKVPILIDGDLKVTDSAAICVYLADKNAEHGMGANPGLAGRAEMDSWMHFAQSELEAPLWNKLRHRFLLPKAVRVDVGPAAAYDFASEIKALDRRLGDRLFALGARFSAVDVLLGDMGGWARAGRFAIESERVNTYFDRVLSRPARARAQANASARKSESIFGKHDA